MRALDASSGRDEEAFASLSAEASALELVAQLPDAVDVTPAAGVDAVAAQPAEALVVGGQRQLWVVQLIQVGAKQRRTQLRVVDRVVQVHPAVQQGRSGPGGGVGLDLHQPDRARPRTRGLVPAALPIGNGEYEIRVQSVVVGGPEQDRAC